MIVQVVAPGEIGGLETVVGALLTASARQGDPARCVALLPPGAAVPHALAEAAEAVGLPVVRLDAPHRRYRAQYRALCAALRALGADVAHSHGYHADVLTAFAARACGIAHVSTLHGFVGGTRRSRVYEALQLRALRRARAVIGVAEPIVHRTVASGVPAGRVHCIPNAAPQPALLAAEDARRELGLSPAGLTVAWVGRLSPEKHPVGFVEVLEALPAELSVTGVMIGDGPCADDVRAAGASLLAAGRLRLAGPLPGAGRYLPAFDALLITSHTEGTPMVALEAMQAGVPVVATAVGGVPALLEEGRCGVLVPAGEPVAMAQAVAQLLAHPDAARALVEAAAARVSTTHAAAGWWARHAALYAAVSRRSGPGAAGFPSRR